jgi:FixJ family two-component response regulator
VGLHVEIFASAEQFTSQCKGDEVGCLLLDVALGGMSGVQLLEKLHDSKSALPVIMITGYGDVAAAVESMKLGAVDYLEKPLDHQVLLRLIRAAFQKATILHSNYIRTSDAKARLSRLTPREREMLQILVNGKSSKQIAAKTGLSIRTVNNHRTHLLAKTGAQNTADMVRLASIAGIA